LTPDPTPQLPDRNLALELVRVTEAAALAAAPLVGMGDKLAADQAAVDGMRYALRSVSMDGLVVIGEGEKDEAPMLYNGEQIGDGSPPQVDIAVDPLEGTTLAAHGMPSALAVIALSARGTMFDPGPCVYMEKMAGSPEIADLLDLDRPLAETVKLVAERKGTPIGDVMVVVLDRPRHEEGVRTIREAGARVRLIAQERAAALEAGYDLQRVLDRDDLVAGEDVFFSATGITDGDVLQGVRYPSAGGATTESLVMRTRSGTVRRIRAQHDRAKLRAVGGERL
jgi:fructose-1,6-bisphosphatase II